MLVLVNHTGLDYTGTAGTIGVNVFFVLSGFLITRLLIEEHDEFGSVSFGYFYARRSLRIFPAMYAFLAVTTVVAIIYAQPLKQLAYAGLYVANLFRAGGGEMPLLPHTWSLAMEEQFYLIWPVLLITLLSIRNARRRTITWVLALGIAASFATRVVLSLNGSSLKRLHNGPDLAAGVLLIGCLLAVWADRLPRSALQRPAYFWLGMAAIVGTSMGEKSVSLYLVWLPLAIVGSTLVIAHLASGIAVPGVGRVMTSRPLLYLGKISYGLYLWHYTVYWVVKQHVRVYPYKPLLQISLSLLVAAVSYHAFEARFLRLKDRMRQSGQRRQEPAQRTAHPLPAPTTVG